MGKAKGKWLLALLALAFAAILAAVLCMNFPMAEVHAETAVAKVTAATGETQTYEKLSDAFMAAKDGDTIDILQDASENSEADLAYGYEAEGGVWMYIQDKSLTINGNGHTLTSNTAAWAMYVIDADDTMDTLKINDLTIVSKVQKIQHPNTDLRGAPIMLFHGYTTLNLNNVTLDSTATGVGNMAPLRVAGNGDNNIINISDSRLLANKNNGYAMIAFNPVDLTVDNSTLSGWSALYMTGTAKGTALGTAGSEVIIQNGSTLTTQSVHNDSSINMFGVLAFEDNNITVDIKDSKITADCTRNAPQYVVYYSNFDKQSRTGIEVNFFNTDVAITGEQMNFVGGYGAPSIKEQDVEVAGGNFNFDVNEDYYAPGYAQNEDGYVLPSDKQDAVAKIEKGDGVVSYYNDLQAAVDAAVDGDVVVVIKDITTSSALIKNTAKAPLAAEIVIDLNGKTITATGSGYYLFELIPTTSLTITSSTGKATVVANQAMQIRADDAPTVDILVENIDFSGTITGNSAIYLNKYGAVEKQNVTLNNVTAVYDNNVGAAITGVVEATGGTHLTVKDSRIEVTNVAAERSRPFIGVYLNNTASTTKGIASSAVIENSTVIANKTAGSEKGSQWGVGIGAYTYDLTVSGGTVTSTDGAGITFYGGVMIDSAAELLDAGNTESFKTLNLEGGVAVSGYTFAVSGNGSSTEANSGTVINVGSATLKGELGVGIYQPQVGILNINAGANIQGSSGIEIRAGELNVTGGNITATWEKLQTYPKQAGSGTSIDGAAVALAFTAETTDGDIYAKLTKVFSEDNAQLVLRYYNEALASIDAATTVSEVTTAVSTFKAQVASVEAAAQNTTNLTGLYVLLVIVLVAVVVVLVIVIVKKNRSAEAAEQPAEEAEQPVPAEEVPAAEPEQPEPAAEENELAAEADDDKEQVVIAANVRSFSEAYVELNEELLDLFNKVKEYALAKDGAAEVKQSNGICIKRNGKQIVKLTVRRGYPVALFFLENEMLKDFRRTTNTNAKLKIRATELVLREAADLEAAYTMVDLSVEQIDKDIENAKERRREARRARRKQKQLEEEAQQQEIAAGSAENGENERP